MVYAFVAGRLAPDAIARIEAHAAGCAACLDLLATATAGAPGLASAAGNETSSTFAVPHRTLNRSAALERGSVVGRYVILGLVGRGGMGDVYAAYDPELDRRIAVKLLGVERSDVAADEARSRLLREAKSIARLSHPNVVVVHDAGTWQDRVFIAMEFVEGETLARWLKIRPRHWREVRDVFVGAGRGLAAAHAAGLVHRDFKPQNVMVGRDGKARVTDFGLARQLDSGELGAGSDASATELASESSLVEEPDTIAARLTRTGALIGTPTYMAPEQFRAEPADARTDQFSFCVALYEALWGQRPFSGDTVLTLKAAVLDGHIREAPEKIAVPAWLRRIIVRGLRIDPDGRFRSMEDLLDALGRDPVRQKRRLLVAGAVVAALVGAGINADRIASRRQGLCRGAADRLAGIWETSTSAAPTPRRTSIQHAFLATNLNWAAGTWERVSRSLDEYANRWTAAYTDACEATHVRGDQSAEVLDLRMGCLQERLGQVKALTDVLTSADPQVLLGAVDAVNALGSLERCSSVAFLPTLVPPPQTEKMRRAVEALRPRLAAVKALRDVGRHKEALQAGTKLVQDARAVGYKPVLAEALALVGWLEGAVLDYPAAEHSLEDAFRTAEAARHDEIRAEVATGLVASFARLSRPDDAERWARESEAILERIGPGHERLLAWLLTDRSFIRCRLGDFAGAVRLDEQALALKEKVLGTDHPDVAISLSNLGAALNALGEYGRALRTDDRALAIYRRAYGETHPWVGECLSNRGETLNALGRYDEARVDFQGALTRWEAALGPDHLYLSYALTGLGETELDTGQPKAAALNLERALRIREHQELDPIQVAETRFALARALWQAGGDRSRARTLATQARAAYATQPLFAPKLRPIDDWLATHDPAPPAQTRVGGRDRGTRKLGRHVTVHASK